jgi:hypothetical protein
MTACMFSSDPFHRQSSFDRAAGTNGVLASSPPPERLKELDEAIAVQVIHCRDRLGVPDERLNVDAIGRPHGVTGARLVGRALSEGKRGDVR